MWLLNVYWKNIYKPWFVIIDVTGESDLKVILKITYPNLGSQMRKHRSSLFEDRTAGALPHRFNFLKIVK